MLGQPIIEDMQPLDSLHPEYGLPTVTVVVAAYNYAGFIGRTLDSALSQDYPAELLDIVIVDDGSTDGTPDVLAEYQRRHPDRITVIRQENAGYVAATNNAVAHARGAVLAILDADDVWPADKTRRQVQCLLDNPDVGLVYCDTEIIDPYDAVRRRSLWEWYEMKPQRGSHAFADIMDTNGNAALASTIILRRDVAAHALPMPLQAPYVDWWVTARIAAVADIEYLGDLRVGYRQHGENLTLGATGMKRVRETLKCLEVRRQLLIHGAGEHLTENELLKAWLAWEGAGLTAVNQAGSVYVPLPTVTDEQRNRGAEHAAAAQAATLRGDVRTALRERINACACNPHDAASREWIHELAWVAKLNEPQDEAAVDPLGSARRFVTLAYCDELVSEPELLSAYASVITEEDDATLAIAAIGLTDGHALQAVTSVAGQAGLDVSTLPDVLVVTDGGPGARIELERRANAVLTRRQAKLVAPAFRPESVSELRALVGV